jgi:hypothetical protein
VYVRVANRAEYPVSFSSTQCRIHVLMWRVPRVALPAARLDGCRISKIHRSLRFCLSDYLSDSVSSSFITYEPIASVSLSIASVLSVDTERTAISASCFATEQRTSAVLNEFSIYALQNPGALCSASLMQGNMQCLTDVHPDQNFLHAAILCHELAWQFSFVSKILCPRVALPCRSFEISHLCQLLRGSVGPLTPGCRKPCLQPYSSRSSGSNLIIHLRSLAYVYNSELINVRVGIYRCASCML